jgi:hypothetical protein
MNPAMADGCQKKGKVQFTIPLRLKGVKLNRTCLCLSIACKYNIWIREAR